MAGKDESGGVSDGFLDKQDSRVGRSTVDEGARAGGRPSATSHLPANSGERDRKVGPRETLFGVSEGLKSPPYDPNLPQHRI